MKKAVSIIVMIIMNILMISDVKACEMSYNEYKDRKIVQSFVVGGYIFNVDNGYSPSLEDFAKAARSIKDGEEVKIYNIMMIGDIYYKTTEVFSNKSTTERNEFPEIDVAYEYRASIRGAKKSDYDLITCKNKDIKIRYTGLYTEGSNEYKRKAIRYASIQSENAIEEAKYCTTIQGSCTPDKELTVKGTENIVEIEYETNASAQKICIEASDKNGSSKIECDEETVKVDKEPIKITKTQESVEIVEGKSKSLGDLFEVKYGVSGGTLQYLSTQEDEKQLINDMSELKNGEAEIEIIATSGSGIVTRETTNVEIRKNKVTYDYWTNGGTTATKETGEVSYNGLADLNVEAKKEGYTFVGWNIDKDAHVGLQTKKITEDITLYAIYKKEVTAEFIVTKNGEKVPAVSEETKKTCTLYGNETNCTIEIPSISAKMGYKAVGWSKTERSKTAEYVGKEKIEINKDEKYYSVTYEKTALSATFITYNGTTPEENVLKCYKYNGESSCQIDVSGLVSKPYEGIPLSGYTKESETPVKEENFEISKGEEYYAYYEKESTLSYVGASKTENVKVKTWYETTREGIKVIQEEKMIPTFNDKEGYTFKGYREDLENEDAEIKEGKQGSKENKTYNGIYERKVKLTYESGEDESNIPAEQTASIYYNAGSKKEKEAEIKLDDGLKITKKNHIFESWNIGGTKYQAGSMVKISKNTKVTAEWTINGSRIILDYQENGGIRADKSSIVYYQGDEEINLKGIKAYKPGWEFIGWSLYADSPGVAIEEYIPEEDVKEVRLYALFKKTITVNYKIRDENAYVLSNSKQEKYTIYNKATSAEVSLATLIKVGKNYTFLGWNRDEKSHEGEYNEGEKVSLSQNTTMYAVIRNDDAVKVTYNYYDGETRKKVEKSCNKYNGEQTCETKSGITNVTTNGGILVGWSGRPDTIKIETKQQNSQNKAYYAVYEKLLTINYKSGVFGSITSSEIYKDKILTNASGKTNLGVDVELDTPDAISGYVTDGWRIDTLAEGKTYSFGETIKVYEDQTYNGVYKKDISLIYNENGGKEKITPTTKKVYYNTTEANIEKSIDVVINGVTSLEGNKLSGWSINNKTYKNGSTISINKTTEAIAVWKANTYNITYDYSTNGGTSVTSHVEEETFGNNIDLTPRGIKEGYTFVGWNENKTATVGQNEIKMPSHDITLYAIYKKEVKAKWILVDTNAGENKLSETTCNKYNNDATCKIETGIVIPKSEYIMDGWDTTQGGTSVIAANNFYYDIASDQTFYSVTRKKQQIVGTFYYGNESEIDVLTSSCILYNGASECTVTVPLTPYMYKETAFSEWSSNKYTATNANMKISENTTYYAHYVRSVSLNYHTGASNTIKTNTNTVEYITSDVGDHETIPKYTIPTPDAISTYTALGWRTDGTRGEGDATYKIGATINLKNSLDLNSVYKRTISLSYNVDGGSPQPETQTTTQYYNSINGASNHLYVLPNNVSKTGYTLKSWAEGSLSGTKYALSYNYYLNKTTTMYAVWEVNSYGVSVNGSNVTINPTSLNINYAGSGKVTITPSNNYYIESASCTNGYTISGLTTGTSATGSQTITINNNSNAQGSTCTIKTAALCPYNIGQTWNYGYTGGSQSFSTPCAGTYKLETWGAQGGNYGSLLGGKGGSMTGTFTLSKGEALTIVTGGQNGYNSGGGATAYGVGGGMTYINSNTKGTLLIAGGGGGATSAQAGGVGGSTAGNISGNAGQAGHAGGGAGGSGGQSGHAHIHSGYAYTTNNTTYYSTSNGCYTNSASLPFTCTVTYNKSGSPVDNGVFNCPVCGRSAHIYTQFYDTHHSACGDSSTDVGKEWYDRVWVNFCGSCGKSTAGAVGVGNQVPSNLYTSNHTYYKTFYSLSCGQTNHASTGGSNYINPAYALSNTPGSGVQSGNGYARITLMSLS